MTTLTQFSSKSAPLWRRFIALIVSVLCLSQLLSAPAFAQMPSAFDDPFVDEPQFLDVDQAFVFDFNQQRDTLTLTFDIADGY